MNVKCTRSFEPDEMAALPSNADARGEAIIAKRGVCTRKKLVVAR